MGRAHSKFYINPKIFNEEVKLSQKNNKITQNLFNYFELLTDKIMTRFFFKNMDDKSDCRQGSLMDLCIATPKFNINKTITVKDIETSKDENGNDFLASIYFTKKKSGEEIKILKKYNKEDIFFNLNDLDDNCEKFNWFLYHPDDIINKEILISQNAFSFFTTVAYFGIARTWNILHPQKYKDTISLTIIDDSGDLVDVC